MCWLDFDVLNNFLKIFSRNRYLLGEIRGKFLYHVSTPHFIDFSCNFPSHTNAELNFWLKFLRHRIVPVGDENKFQLKLLNVYYILGVKFSHFGTTATKCLKSLRFHHISQETTIQVTKYFSHVLTWQSSMLRRRVYRVQQNCPHFCAKFPSKMFFILPRDGDWIWKVSKI